MTGNYENSRGTGREERVMCGKVEREARDTRKARKFGQEMEWRHNGERDYLTRDDGREKEDNEEVDRTIGADLVFSLCRPVMVNS